MKIPQNNLPSSPYNNSLHFSPRTQSTLSVPGSSARVSPSMDHQSLDDFEFPSWVESAVPINDILDRTDQVLIFFLILIFLFSFFSLTITGAVKNINVILKNWKKFPKVGSFPKSRGTVAFRADIFRGGIVKYSNFPWFKLIFLWKLIIIDSISLFFS